MPRQTGIFVENNFVRGLITEATGLTFPENACTETYDCVFKRTGEVVRRKGFEYEVNYSLFTLTASRSNSAVSSYLWTGAGGSGEKDFVVVQVGRYIYFYSVNTSLSSNKHATTIDLNNYDVTGSSDPYSYACNFSSGDGKLFVVGKYIEPFYVVYDPDADTLTATQITIKIRDIRGDPLDTLDIDRRPTSTSTTTDTELALAHIYNLWNQGWADDVLVDDAGSATPGSKNALKDWDDARTDLPSNSDRWWQLKNASDEMDMGEVDKFPSTTGVVPKGRFIYNAFDLDRNGARNAKNQSIDTVYSRSGTYTQGNGSLTSETTIERPQAIAFFANRVFYAGVDEDGWNTKVYFSQILSNIDNAGKCYQAQDPTSEDFYDLLPTDGGELVIPGMARVVQMMESNNSLIIFATNGIWTITGSEGIGFTATDFSVNKISSVQNLGNRSFVDLNGLPCWINGDGIWVLKQDETLGGIGATSLTNQTIQTFFEDIPPANLPYIKGVYNPIERIVYWLYRSTSATSLDNQYEYDRVLCFNTETGAFYPWKLNTDITVKVIDVNLAKGFGVNAVVEEQISLLNGDLVVDSGVSGVTETSIGDFSISGTVKFLTENGSNQITWSEAKDTDYLDWTTAKGTGKDYESYFVTGYKVRGEGLRTQQTGYVRIHSRVEDNSSLKVRGVWDYYTTDGARWSTEQQAYRSSTTSSFTDRRLRIRGHGVALQMRFGSETGKPFNCTGWSTEDSIAVKP